MNPVLSYFKASLTMAGAHLSEGALHRMQMVVNYMKLGRWVANHDFAPQRVMDRNAVFDAVAKRVKDRKVLYLEFGVWEGRSIRYWSEALRNPDSMLHGFDSFEGLPEDFDVKGPYSKGSFNVGGRIPQIDDPRVKFFKGWFEDSLPTYQVPSYDTLVICLDADLYSATIFVLRQLRDHIKPGTFVYFDDMSRPDHEPRAFDEFVAETGRRFQPLVADMPLNRIFFECVG